MLASLLFSSEVAKALDKSSQTQDPEAQKNVRPWSLALRTSVSTSLHRNSDLDKQLSSSFAIYPGHKLKNGVKVGSFLSATKNLLNERKWTWNNSYVSFSKQLGKLHHFNVSGLALVHIPLSEESKDIQKLRTAIMIAPILTYDLKNLDLKNLERWSISYSPAITQYFHQYTTSLTGNSNTRTTLSSQLKLNFSLNDFIHFRLTGTYSKSFTYSGGQQDLYGVSTLLSYAPTSNFSIDIGHRNIGSPLAANGKDIEIDFINSRTSSVYIAFGYQF